MTDLIVITGPTAVGKTAAAIALAKKINGEIVSADSMQVYKYMDIGTAKPSADELALVTHHMVGVVEPDEAFSAARYQRMARACIDDIAERGKTPVLTGGSGFYINAVLKNIEYDETEKDDAYRNWLYRQAETNGARYLHEWLKHADPVSYEKIHPNNVKRVARALEFYKETGKRISEVSESQKKSGIYYNARTYILSMDRKLLYERIDARTERMFDDGFVEEVRSLLLRGYTADLPPMQGLGYKEVLQYLNGFIDLPDAVENVKQATRRYAKRQLTWFKNQTDGTRADVPDEKSFTSFIGDVVQSHK